MRRQRRLALSITLSSLGGCAALACALLVSPAYADGGTTAPSSTAAPSMSGAPAMGNGGADTTGSEDEELGTSDEKPDHKAKRRTYIRRTKKSIDEVVHASTSDLTDDEKAAIKKHWHVSMRLWRIRHLADQANDKASVAKVDALLQKADDKTMAKLKELAAKAAPAASGAKK